MRTSSRIILALMLGAAPMAAAPGFAFDGAPVKPDAAMPSLNQPPAAAAVTAQALKNVPPAAAGAATATAFAAPSLNSLQ